MQQSEAIILRAKCGDSKAFNRLVALWHQRIYNFAYKYFGGHDMAMEVSQRTFIAVYKGLKRLKDVGKFKPWIYRIAVNMCHEEDRKRNRSTVPLEGVSEAESHTIQLSAYGPERNMRQKELNQLLLEALSEINEEQRLVVIMKEYEGLKFREIAETLDISENTVKSRMYYGLTTLKKILTARNISKEVYYE